MIIQKEPPFFLILMVVDFQCTLPKFNMESENGTLE